MVKLKKPYGLLWAMSTLGLMAVAGCDMAAKKVTKEGSATAEVTRQDLTGYRFYDAQVVVPPTATATVTSHFQLPVSELLTAVGKKVRRGDTLMRLSVPEASAMLSQAQANLSTAQRDYSAAKSQNEGPLKEAARQLAEARKAEAQAVRDQSEGTTADVEGAVQARKDAEAAYVAAKSDFDSSVQNERQGIDSAMQFVSEARAGAKMASIKAPISGTVVALDAVVGSNVGTDPKAPVATITDYDQVKVVATVPAEAKDDVKVGTTVLFTPTDKGIGPVEGKVTSVKVLPPKPGEKGSHYMATISFDNSKGLVKPSTIVKKAGVKTGHVESVLVVPVAAVTINKEGKPVVTVQEGSQTRDVVVETGLSDGALIEVKSGLTEGQIVRVRTQVP